MKKYKIHSPINPITGLHVGYMGEDSAGEWVKWEDVFKTSINREIEEAYQNGYEKGLERIKQLKQEIKRLSSIISWCPCTCDTAPCTCGALNTFYPPVPSPKCNCEEEIESFSKQKQDLMDKFVIPQLIPENHSWICLAHGYKKR